MCDFSLFEYHFMKSHFSQKVKSPDLFIQTIKGKHFKKPATGLFPTKESLGQRYESYFFLFDSEDQPFIPILYGPYMLKIEIYS